MTLTKQQDTVSTSIRNLNTRMMTESVKNTLLIAKAFKKNAKEGCPVLKGDLKDSIGNPRKNGIWEVSKNGLRIKVGTRIKYAAAVEHGIKRPYWIKAKDGKVLAFHWKKVGRKVFFSKVKHPKIKGKFFMRNASIKTKHESKMLIMRR